MLKGKKIVLGITGGIAAYKCPALIRNLVNAGAEVEVVVTNSALEFVTPLTLETVSGRRVHRYLFPKDRYAATVHIDLADWADVVVIAPATANFIAKMRAGAGDDLLSTICLAAWSKTIIAPSMNPNMWMNPATQENLSALEKRGYLLIQPDKGDLACGYTGVGRLPDNEVIQFWIQYYLTQKKALVNKRILITAGRTEEPLDPVRILTNRSSAKMGFALAEHAFFKGAGVTLIAGPNALPHIPGIQYHCVASALEMAAMVNRYIGNSDIVIAAAAVSDYRPAKTDKQKIKKSGDTHNLMLMSNPDILASLRKKNPKAFLMGFALETENALENAAKKLRQKKLDLIAVNPADALASENNRLSLLYKDGHIKELAVVTKREAACEIINEIERLI